MRRLALAMLAALSLGAADRAPTAPVAVEVGRIDCGRIWVPDLNEYSDTRAYTGRSMEIVASCYLVRHGADLMLWDAGLPADSRGRPLTRGREDEATFASTIREQLAAAGVDPGRVSVLGISHFHFNHTGQAGDFPTARLLIGEGDLKALREPGSRRAAPLARWIGGGGRVEGVTGDRDVFGDGTVVMLDLPGHTPGHHGLLVRPTRGRPILLSGDVAHFRENLARDEVTTFNDDRARSLASMDRFRRLARNLGAVVVIQHDPRDVAKVPPLSAPADAGRTARPAAERR